MIPTWPYLTRLELLVALGVLVAVTVWSILIDAPLEAKADLNSTPNPSKAPWYFLGLQEMLKYFDPWFAGMLLPGLIIVGLTLIPYLDKNPKGNGYYTLTERKFAISTFLFGFVGLWIILIVIATFFRGPGWNFFWPGQYWDPHKTVAQTNVDLPYLLGAHSAWARAFVGTILVAVIFGWPLLLLPIARTRKWFQNLGTVRYLVTGLLFSTMMSLPIKMILNALFNVRYFLRTEWLNI